MRIQDIREYGGNKYQDTNPGLAAGNLEKVLKSGMATLGLAVTHSVTRMSNGDILHRDWDYGTMRAIRLDFAEEAFGHGVSSFNRLSTQELSSLRWFMEQPEHQKNVTLWLGLRYGRTTVWSKEGSWA